MQKIIAYFRRFLGQGAPSNSETILDEKRHLLFYRSARLGQ